MENNLAASGAPGNLAAPASNKAANRRSGFYGVMNLGTSPRATSPVSPSGFAHSSDGLTPLATLSSSEDTREDYFMVPRSDSAGSSGIHRIRITGSSTEASLEETSTSAMSPLTTDGRELPSGTPELDRRQISGHSTSTSSSSLAATDSTATSSASSSDHETKPSQPQSRSSVSGSHTSASFYDPDVLVFLQAVNDPENPILQGQRLSLSDTPTRTAGYHTGEETDSSFSGLSPSLSPNPAYASEGGAAGSTARRSSTSSAKNNKRLSALSNGSGQLTPRRQPSTSTSDYEDEEQEHLSPLSTTKRDSRISNSLGLSVNGRVAGRSGAAAAVGGSRLEDESDDEKARDALRKVRESIRRSRGGSLSSGSGGLQRANSGMTLDVELVELLISELEQTKNKMKELQKNYNAIRVS